MSRRRLEAAIQAGKAIEEGRSIPTILEKVDIYQTYPYEDIRDGVYCLQYSFDGTKLVVGYGDGGIEVLNVVSGDLKREVRRRRVNAMAVTCIRFNPEEHHLCYAGSAEGKVAMCSIVHGSWKDIVSEPDNEINCLDFNINGSSFATAGRDLDVRIYDTSTNKLVRRYPGYSYLSPDQASLAGHAQRVFALRYHPEEKDVFITGGWENHLKIWDSRTDSGVQRTINGPHVCGDSLDIKGPQILTGSWVPEDALQIWDFSSGKLMQTLPVPTSVPIPGAGDNEANKVKRGEFLYSAQFGGNDLVLAGGSGTNSGFVVNTKKQQIIGEVPIDKAVQTIDSTGGGQFFAVGGVGCKLKLAKMT